MENVRKLAYFFSEHESKPECNGVMSSFLCNGKKKKQKWAESSFDTWNFLENDKIQPQL